MFQARDWLKAKFESPVKLLHMLRVAGVEPPSKDAAIKWFARDRIPGEWFPVLLAVLEHYGIPADLNDYSKGG